MKKRVSEQDAIVNEPVGRRRRGELAFQIINSVLVVAILGFYAYRLFYYKADFAKKKSTANTVFLSDTLINKIDLMSTSGLHENQDGSYSVLGAATDNYVLYTGLIYRVIGINTNGNVMMVSQDSVTSFTMADGTAFTGTSLYAWLNESTADQRSGVFYKTLNMPYGTLTGSAMCQDTVDDVANIGCQLVSDKVTVGLLTLNDYKTAGAKDSFLNNGQSFWLGSTNKAGRFWYVTADGSLTVATGNNQMNGVRPVLTLSYEVIAASGKGTASDPYVINSNTATAVGQAQVGEYVTFGGLTWRLEQAASDGMVAILDGVIADGQGGDYATTYGTGNTFSTASGLGKYLNTTFLKSLGKYGDCLVKRQWTYGGYTSTSLLDYHDVFSNSYTAYVGLPDTSYLFLNEQNGIFLSTYSTDSGKMIYTIDDNGNLFASLTSDKHKCRPVICFKADLAIQGGSGTTDDPYQVEVVA